MRASDRSAWRLSTPPFRMGVTIQQVAQLRFAAKYAGSDIGTLEGVMRKLPRRSRAAARTCRRWASTTATWRRALCVPTADVLVSLSEKLAALPAGFERNAAAVKVLGRAGLEVLPDLLQLPEGLKARAGAAEVVLRSRPGAMEVVPARGRRDRVRVESLKRSMAEPWPP